MRSKRTRDIVRKIAEEENLTIKQVDEIVYSFFRFTSQKMSEGDRKNLEYSSIRLFKFGVFRVKEGRKRFLKRKDEKSLRNRTRRIANQSGSLDDKGVQSNLESGPFDEKEQSSE